MIYLGFAVFFAVHFVRAVVEARWRDAGYLLIVLILSGVIVGVFSDVDGFDPRETIKGWGVAGLAVLVHQSFRVLQALADWLQVHVMAVPLPRGRRVR